ncbi:MAG: response regulator transcription factor [Anaerolineales bacterium]|nr:response regulator transcription factor [Anaerolineales bacterium]
MIKILIADDHLLIRQGLRLVLDTEPDLELVGEASDGNEALSLCKKLKPDVVLMDLRMPNMDGLTAIEKLRVEQPEIAVVILTTFNEDELMLRGLQAGARGYLLKDTDRSTLFDTIRAAARGETLLKPEIMRRVLSQTNAPKATSSEPTNLTERELEVLEAVARGERSKEIAVQLGISERTVKAHLASIYSKLGVDSRAAAIAVAAQRGLLENSHL